MPRLLRFAFWAALLFTLIMASLPKPPALPGAPSDKIQHILAFVVLAGLGSAAYPRLGALKLLLGLMAFGALIEIVQLIPGLNRQGDPVDWVADTVAAAVIVGLWSAARRRRPGTAPEPK